MRSGKTINHGFCRSLGTGKPHSYGSARTEPCFFRIVHVKPPSCSTCLCRPRTPLGPVSSRHLFLRGRLEVQGRRAVRHLPACHEDNRCHYRDRGPDGGGCSTRHRFWLRGPDALGRFSAREKIAVCDIMSADLAGAGFSPTLRKPSTKRVRNRRIVRQQCSRTSLLRGIDVVRMVHHGTCCRPWLLPQPRGGEAPSFARGRNACARLPQLP